MLGGRLTSHTAPGASLLLSCRILLADRLPAGPSGPRSLSTGTRQCLKATKSAQARGWPACWGRRRPLASARALLCAGRAPERAQAAGTGAGRPAAAVPQAQA